MKKQKWNLEHDEVGGPPGEHDDGLVGQGGVHHLVGHKLGVQDLDDLALKREESKEGGGGF